jgi:tryptophan synthase
MAARLTAAFSKKPAFVGYVTAGFPSRADTVPALSAMAESGVDIIELGVPFSDPMADGGTIQKANQVALEAGVTLRDCIDFVKAARSQGLAAPVVFMGYYNPFLQYGEDRLIADCKAAGVDGFIMVDLPPEDAAEFIAKCDAAGLGFIPLVAPTSAKERLPRIASLARGFVYCVSVTGVTGARTELPPDLTRLVADVKAAVALPVAVGFGIATREQVQQVGAIADGVVVGSAIINKLQAGGVAGLREYLREVVPKR